MSRTLDLDASAIVKLVHDERESAALRQRVVDSQLVSCEIAEVETRRTLRRHALDHRADDALSLVYLYSLDPLLRRSASQLHPPTLRTLDALHLATALRLHPELSAFISYDDRLSTAARASGLQVETPGR